MCATSIGLTFSQSPLPGVRKSGMPDGTDTPAPVSTTADCASRSISARRVASLVRVFVATWLLAFEPRRPLPEEGADALLRVLRVERRLEAARLRLEALAELARGRHGFDLLDRHRRLLRELARPQERRVEQLVVRDDLVHETELLRLVRADRRAEQVELQ